jgi:tyrosyl-tRNA synthetase
MEIHKFDKNTVKGLDGMADYISMSNRHHNNWQHSIDYYESCVRVFHVEISDVIHYNDEDTQITSFADHIHFIKTAYQNMQAIMPVIED